MCATVVCLCHTSTCSVPRTCTFQAHKAAPLIFRVSFLSFPPYHLSPIQPSLLLKHHHEFLKRMTERETTWTTDAAAEDSTPSYASAIHSGPVLEDSRNGLPLQRLQEQLPPLPSLPSLPSPSSPTSSGLQATLELDSDTIDIYDRSNDSFQYSLKGTVELNWTGDKELLLKEARIDFLGYAVCPKHVCLFALSPKSHFSCEAEEKPAVR